MNALTTPNLPWRDRPFAELLRLAWPIAIQLISFSTMTAVDTLFVGHLGSTALAGVALGSAATFTVICFGFGMLRSTNITIAQAVGAGRQQQVLALTGAGITLAVGLGLVTALVGQLGAGLLPLLTSSDASGHSAAAYARVRVLGAPLQFVELALAGARFGAGDSRSPMIATLLANATNVLLVAAFSLVLHAGVTGVAAATVLSGFAEVYVLARRQRHAGFGLRAWTHADLRLLFKLGIPLGVERFFDMGAVGVLIALIARMGDLELAAHQVAHQSLLFGFMPVMAIGDAAAVLIGQAIGAGSVRSIPRVQAAALLAGLGYVGLCSAVYLGLGPWLAALFSEDPGVIARAAQLLVIGSLLVWAVPFYVVGQSTLRAIGDVRVASLITVISAWGCTTGFGALFGFGLGLGARGAWLGYATDFCLASCAFWWRFRGRGSAWLGHVRRYRSELRRASAEPLPAAEGVPAPVISA
jgi:MATE family multidrug resistance protein